MRRFLLLLSAALPLLSHADEAAPSLKGTWRAYVTTQGVVTGRTDTRYVFGDLGWAIRDATGTRPQDWYRAEDGKLLLRPAADAFPAGFDAADAALTATLEKGADAFVFSMPGASRHALRFEREAARPALSAALDRLIGHLTAYREALDREDPKALAEKLSVSAARKRKMDLPGPDLLE